MGNYHARCGAGEKPEVITPEAYLSLCGKIPGLLQVHAIIRKYNVSLNFIIQTFSQLKEMYKDSWETLVGNCDIMIYLGGQAPSDVKMISEKLGKGTIKSHSYNLNAKSNGESYQNLGRQLMTADEIAAVPRSKEIVFITGQKPFIVDKYNLKKHPNYKYSGEADPKNNLSMLDLKNEIDEDLLDELTITVEEVQKLELKDKRRKKNTDPSEGTKKTDLDAPTDPNGMPSLDELDRRKEAIENADKTLNQSADETIAMIFMSMGLVDDVYQNYSPDYEFLQTDFLTPEEAAEEEGNSSEKEVKENDTEETTDTSEEGIFEDVPDEPDGNFDNFPDDSFDDFPDEFPDEF